MIVRLWRQLREWLAGRTAGPAAARIGKAGEWAAESHLRAAGFRIVARNWRNPADAREEIDLVCRDGETLVFVEVKTRAAGARVGGYAAVDGRKKKALLRACRAYLARLRPPPQHWRFDVCEVEHGNDPEKVWQWRAMRLPLELGSEQGGHRVVHHRNVPLFPERANHRHG